jgi:hypothetical protein
MLRTLRACVPFGVVFFLAACAEPPHKEMNQAQGAIDAARAAGADTYAGQDLAGAVDALKRSEDAVAQRDYRLALSHAIDSRERAQNAAKAAVDNRAKARGDAERVVAEANASLTLARTRLTDAVVSKLARRRAAEVKVAFGAAENTMQEARAALARDDYAEAMRAARAVTTRIQETLGSLDKQEAPAPVRKRR